MTIKKKLIGIGFLMTIAFAMVTGALTYLNSSLGDSFANYRDKTDQLQGVLQLNTSVVGLMEASNFAIVQTIMGEDTDLISQTLKQQFAEHDQVRAKFEIPGEAGEKITALDKDLKTHLDSVYELILAGDSYGAGEDLVAIKAISVEIFSLSESMKENLIENYQSSLKAQARNKTIFFALISVVFLVLGSLWTYTTRSILKVNSDFSSKLAESSDTVNSVSAQVSEFSRSSAERASNQAASIEETSASLEMISSMTQKTASSANQVDTLMGEANFVINKANQTMGQLNGAMAEIYKASEDTSKIINTIDEIAFQTNLLALNAAVEAARAGDAGKGFAVVAEEVRNLAKRAADAAKSTTGLIEQTVNKVNGGRALVTTTNDAFAEVSSSTTKVAELVSEIASISSDQADGIQQVNSAVSEMDMLVQQNAANAEESAAVSNEMDTQAAKMKSYIDDFVAQMGTQS